MKHDRCNILLAATLATILPATATATPANIVFSGNSVTVENAQGKILEVISLTGRHVMKKRIESQSQHVELNIPKGCYILKVDNVVRKVSIA